jgi:ATP-binding cassette subfamily B protein
VQTSLACSTIFEYLDQPIDIEESLTLFLSGQPGDVAFDQSGSGTATTGPSRRLLHRCRPATTALVGETGSGKTTLGYLTARLYDASRGRITIAGVDIRDLSFQALSDLVGVVSRRRISSRIDTGEPALRQAGRDRRGDRETAEAARIHHADRRTAGGYDTVVGERGYRFSGGEKQRIAIARTILRNPPIPRARRRRRNSLDTETNGSFRRRSTGSRGRTTIAIAHRLSTVRVPIRSSSSTVGALSRRARTRAILAGGRYTALATRDADLGAAAPVLR